ncbi:MAG: class III extradiol ring-cleavage dioxygenase [Sulfuricella sp.]
MSILPTLFVPHGAPTFALAPGPAGQAMCDWACRIEKPRAVLVVSAHWDTAEPCLGAAMRPETIHDFWGFPDALNELGYPATGAPGVAMKAKQLLDAGGFHAALDHERGLDHGAWIPLRILFPTAGVPVATLSIQSALGPRHHYRVGQALAPLAAQGVLIVASGNLTHNLSHYRPAAAGAGEPPYVGRFQAWFWDRLVARDVESLLAYRGLAPGSVEAHPRDDHLLPLFVALGAAGPDFTAERVFKGVYENMLAMDSFAFWPS